MVKRTGSPLKYTGTPLKCNARKSPLLSGPRFLWETPSIRQRAHALQTLRATQPWTMLKGFHSRKFCRSSGSLAKKNTTHKQNPQTLPNQCSPQPAAWLAKKQVDRQTLRRLSAIHEHGEANREGVALLSPGGFPKVRSLCWELGKLGRGPSQLHPRLTSWMGHKKSEFFWFAKMVQTQRVCSGAQK